MSSPDLLCFPSLMTFFEKKLGMTDSLMIRSVALSLCHHSRFALLGEFPAAPAPAPAQIRKLTSWNTNIGCLVERINFDLRKAFVCQTTG